MMKIGFANTMHENWNYTNNFASSLPPPTTSSSISSSFPKPQIENQTLNNFVQNEECNWVVENITKHLDEELQELPQEIHQITTYDHNNNFLISNNHTTRASSHENLVSSSSSLSLHTQRKITFWKTPFDPFTNVSDPTIINNHPEDLDHNNIISHHNNLHDHGLSLITLLMECAVAISIENLNDAHKVLLEMSQLASPYKPSCAERVIAYFAKAMSNRVMNSYLGVSSPLIDHKNIHSSFQVFNNVSPFTKFAHFTSNQAILESVNRSQSIHIIDLDIMQGLQWPAFFHILATRIEGQPEVRMTGFGSSMELLLETGKQLSNFARRLGMCFKFHPITTKFGEIDPSMVQIRPNETLAVHWLQHSLYDATGPDWKTIILLQKLKPRIITLVEQDVNHGGSFLDRFVGSLHYYSTLFDSLGAYLPIDDPNRYKVEHDLLSKEINNILAIGGPARSGEDKFRNWRRELVSRHNCFLQVPMSANSMAQAQLILNMFSPSHGYSLAQVDGTLRLGWKDTSLYTASAWTCSPSR